MDEKARAILFSTYWGSGGWKSAPVTSPADLAYAKSKGLMFDPLSIDHDQCVHEILESKARISSTKPAQCFLSSLSSRRPDRRSGLASYVVAGQLMRHRYHSVATGQGYGPDGSIIGTSYGCGSCGPLGFSKESYRDEDLSVLNFERIKWGGVRHGDIIYTLFDLQQLERDLSPEPTAADLAIFQAILALISSSQAEDTPGKLERNTGVLPSSKHERRQLIEVLACAGILKASRSRPFRWSDWHHAASWRGEDRYDTDAVRRHFSPWLPAA
jgi:hypothetical protein